MFIKWEVNNYVKHEKGYSSEDLVIIFPGSLVEAGEKVGLDRFSRWTRP